MTERQKTNPELDRALAHILALPKPPTCPQCSGVIEASWWSYCAACGFHIAAHGEQADHPVGVNKLISDT